MDKTIQKITIATKKCISLNMYLLLPSVIFKDEMVFQPHSPIKTGVTISNEKVHTIGCRKIEITNN